MKLKNRIEGETRRYSGTITKNGKTKSLARQFVNHKKILIEFRIKSCADRDGTNTSLRQARAHTHTILAIIYNNK